MSFPLNRSEKIKKINHSNILQQANINVHKMFIWWGIPFLQLATGGQLRRRNKLQQQRKI